MKRSWYSPQELLTLYHIERNLSKIKGELREIDSAAAQNGNSSQPQNGDQIQASSSTAGEMSHWTSTAESVDVSKVHGFDDEVLSLEKFLFQKETDDQLKASGIVGTAGIGKTTLCQLIFDKAEVKNHFVPRIWVCMSRKPDEDQDVRVAIVKRMLTELGVEEEIIDSVSSSHGLSGLLCALHLELAGKRYLIVLEDAREREVWYGQLNSCLTRDRKWHERLAYGLPKGSGGAVIVTSTNEEMAKMMVGEKNLHHLLPREDSESCWEIFKDAVLEGGNTEFDPSNVEDLKKEIKQKCAGLPLAAKMMGQIMRKQIQDNRQTAVSIEINQQV